MNFIAVADLPFVATPEHGVQPVYIPITVGEVQVYEGSRGTTLIMPPEVWRSIAEQILGVKSPMTVPDPSTN